MTIEYINRKTGKKEKEIISAEKMLAWAYGKKSGRCFMELLGKYKGVSWLYGVVQKLPSTKKKIQPFVDHLKINMKEALLENPEDYGSFNEFFTRHLKPGSRIIEKDPRGVVSPSDGRILLYPKIEMGQLIQVKGKTSSIASVLGCEELANSFLGGSAAVIRLAPSDYHRFHFPVDGIPRNTTLIKGCYYSVNPYALREVKKVYSKNKRMVTIIQSFMFGKVAMIEVGATMVGSIVQTYWPGVPVNRGAEKGYFQFGGSTVILIFEKGVLHWHSDLVKNTQDGFETLVQMGESIANINK